MHISKTLAVVATGVALAAAAAIPAAAGASHSAHPASKGTFHSTISPSVVHPGQTLTLKGTGAKHKTAYSCALVVVKGSNYGLGSVSATTSNKHGKVKCSTTFQPFSATPINGGPTRHCPTTKADRKAGFQCGYAVSTADKKSNSISYFKAKKH